jgi:hypothetical protein
VVKRGHSPQKMLGQIALVVALCLGGLLVNGCAMNPKSSNPVTGAQAPTSQGVAADPGASEPAATEPEPVVEEQAAPDPIVISGKGKRASKKFELVGGTTYVTSICNGGHSNFVVSLVNADTGDETLVANEIGKAKTSRVEFPDAGTYLLDVESDSSWKVTITQPSIGAVPETKRWTGKGTQATAPFYITDGVKTFTFKNKGGDSNFVVEIFGAADDLIANEIGPSSGSSVVTVDEAGGAVIQVQSDGTWTLTYE